MPDNRSPEKSPLAAADKPAIPLPARTLSPGRISILGEGLETPRSAHC